ncbi:transketolase [Ketobacter sp. MCCC 1A13808]|uniref:transketolase n=1 Tax=Ketobacter sp. MCCC 1A13808 TaxID=2602738 RepID=UPI0012EB132E|nr:transketolase [Ketobacter sp. MCCC 1A13808]MVF11866.1 transketolase [Ketobacter sp. MCCC 1A13808]
MPTRSELANAIRALSMDAVQKANSGHPGAPMGMADIAQVLWCDYLRHNPANPEWVDRDRFVMSNGHGSMLIYSLLHLTGYDLPIEELQNFRQLDSKTPGHPEYGYTPGVETTTGPLGQGIANAVGMAIAEKVLAAQFNRGAYNVVDHNTYVFMGDGCMMEGISHEVCSLAGTLGLGKLIAFYDDNGISIDGEVVGWFSDDTAKRFESYGWHVIPQVDGHSTEELIAAVEMAKANPDRPTLICCKTIIGFGSPNKQGKEECHGAALGDDEIVLTRKQLGWTHAPFHVPQDIYDAWSAKEKGAKAESDWQRLFDNYRNEYPELAAEFERRTKGDLPADWEAQASAYIKEVQAAGEKVASRKASQNCLNAFGPILPELLGGSADLAGSNLTIWKGSKGVSAEDASGNYIYWGVREFGMTAAINGIALHGGFITYGATFLIFMEYARNAMRMAALMKKQNIQVYTHDSIGLGEDGPTHQPIEQLTNLRTTPNMSVWRPCDAAESAVAWKAAIERKDGPSALVFSRQGLAPMTRSDQQLSDVAKGGYVLKAFADGQQDALIIATGSEVELAMSAAETLAGKGKNVSVVSMPSVDLFLKQDAAYRESVLPAAVRARVAVEAGMVDFWYKLVGLDGAVVGMTTFGESAPAGDLFKHFGITAENVVAAVEGVL